MDLLVAMRALTLAGWLVLVSCLLYVVFVPGRYLPPPIRMAWAIMFFRHTFIAITTAMVEVLWVLNAVAPESWLYQVGKGGYNPAYLVNAMVDATTPFLVVALLAGSVAVRRICMATVVSTLVLAIMAAASGATRDWSTLMNWTQVLGFVSIGGYLTFCGLFLLGNLIRVDTYLLGLIAVAAMFAILLPVQAEFFELVGRANAVQIWHLNEFLQLAVMSTELAIVLAYINHSRSIHRNRVSVVAAGAGD